MRPRPLTDPLAKTAQALPEALDREHALLPLLRRLGVPENELAVLRGDEQLLEILAREAQNPAALESRAAFEQVLASHRARLARVASREG